jgi:hypothetical protein
MQDGSIWASPMVQHAYILDGPYLTLNVLIRVHAVILIYIIAKLQYGSIWRLPIV